MTNEGTGERIVFHNPDSGWTVLKLEGEDGRRIPAVGKLPGVQAGESLRLSGSWRRDPKYGRQFQIDSFASLEPASLEGLERFLGSGGLPGVGPATARRIVERFGEETLAVLDEAPDRLTEVSGIGKVKSARIVEAWKQKRVARDALIFLQQHEVSAALAARIVRHYGEATAGVAKSNPYRLAEEVSGVGFGLADKLALQLGLGRDTVERAASGLLYTLRRAADTGHTFLEIDDLLARGAALLELEAERLRQGLDLLNERGSAVLRQIGGAETVSLATLAGAELAIARGLRRIRSAKTAPAVSNVDAALDWGRGRQGLELAPLRSGLCAWL